MAGALFIHPFATINIKAQVPMTLELSHSNYSKWASFFKVMCGSSAFFPNSFPPHCTDPLWE